MIDPSLDGFARLAGSVFSVTTEGGPVELTLITVEDLSDRPSAKGASKKPFSLLFRGPATPLLPQMTYEFRLGEDSIPIFIVPIGQDDEGSWYEAIFT